MRDHQEQTLGIWVFEAHLKSLLTINIRATGSLNKLIYLGMWRERQKGGKIGHDFGWNGFK